jgi:hypothetical protein
MRKGAAQCPAPQPRDRRWVVIAVVQGLLRGIAYSLMTSKGPAYPTVVMKLCHATCST